eukprot:scaffold593_cov382-Prasinococcus_capsulatus_cf.AAC.14
MSLDGRPQLQHALCDCLIPRRTAHCTAHIHRTGTLCPRAPSARHLGQLQFSTSPRTILHGHEQFLPPSEPKLEVTEAAEVADSQAIPVHGLHGGPRARPRGRESGHQGLAEYSHSRHVPVYMQACALCTREHIAAERVRGGQHTGVNGVENVLDKCVAVVSRAHTRETHRMRRHMSRRAAKMHRQLPLAVCHHFQSGPSCRRVTEARQGRLRVPGTGSWASAARPERGGGQHVGLHVRVWCTGVGLPLPMPADGLLHLTPGQVVADLLRQVAARAYPVVHTPILLRQQPLDLHPASGPPLSAPDRCAPHTCSPLSGSYLGQDLLVLQLPQVLLCAGAEHQPLPNAPVPSPECVELCCAQNQGLPRRQRGNCSAGRCQQDRHHVIRQVSKGYGARGANHLPDLMVHERACSYRHSNDPSRADRLLRVAKTVHLPVELLDHPVVRIEVVLPIDNASLLRQPTLLHSP